jgi:sirohydrochlorin cobaltochelatase
MTQPHIVLLAHGSRDPMWCATFEHGQAQINKGLTEDASLAYMEMAKPSLEQVVTGLYKEGKSQIVVIPLFFAAGRHLLHDVPKTIQHLSKQLSGLDIELHEALGHKDEFWAFLGLLLAKEVKALAK